MNENTQAENANNNQNANAEQPKTDTPKKEPETGAQPKAAKMSKGMKITLWCLGAVAAVAAAVGGAMALSKKSNETAEAAAA